MFLLYKDKKQQFNLDSKDIDNKKIVHEFLILFKQNIRQKPKEENFYSIITNVKFLKKSKALVR